MQLKFFQEIQSLVLQKSSSDIRLLLFHLSKLLAVILSLSSDIRLLPEEQFTHPDDCVCSSLIEMWTFNNYFDLLPLD